MYLLNEIRCVDLEISTLCNAACPWCPRNFWGYPHNDGYPELNMTLEQVKKIFSPDFLKQLTAINVNGNYGDLVMNPESPDIIDYFVKTNPNISILVNTNGSARSADFWRALVHDNVQIQFALDGLDDTHHLYRQNTNWHTVIKNAKIYIQAGGQAVWKMIKFDHNQHQIDLCRQMSKELNFKNFLVIRGERTNAPVFNKHGEFSHVLGSYSGPTEFPVLFHKKISTELLLNDILPGKSPKLINCYAKKEKSIYISATGDVSPCCWLGFYPETYGHGNYHQVTNSQIKPLVSRNNALKYTLDQCIEWFNNVEKSWEIPTFDSGRLVICNDACGQK